MNFTSDTVLLQEPPAVYSIISSGRTAQTINALYVSFKHQGTRIYPPMITGLDQNYIFIIICWLVASRLVISLVTWKRGQLKQSCRRKRCACSRTTLHNHESSEPRTDVKCNLSTLHARVSYRHLIYLSAHRQVNGRPHGFKNCFNLHRFYWSYQ